MHPWLAGILRSAPHLQIASDATEKYTADY